MTLNSDELEVDKKDIAFLKNMSPNRDFQDRIDQYHAKEKRKLARLKTLENKNFGPADISGRDSSNQRKLIRSSTNDLGPLENYLHLIDPELRKGDAPIVYNTAQRILDNLSNLNLDDVTTIIDECERIVNQGFDLNEQYLEKLLRDVKLLYTKFENSGDLDVSLVE